jgi:hypothetical protein
MKSKIYFLIACVLLAQVSMAQFTIGAKVGANLTKIDGRSFKDELKQATWQVGLLSLA